MESRNDAHGKHPYGDVYTELNKKYEADYGKVPALVDELKSKIPVGFTLNCMKELEEGEISGRYIPIIEVTFLGFHDEFEARQGNPDYAGRSPSYEDVELVMKAIPDYLEVNGFHAQRIFISNLDDPAGEGIVKFMVTK